MRYPAVTRDRTLRRSALSLAVALPLTLFCAFSAVGADRGAYRLPTTIPFPAANPYTPEKAALGKMLYFDPRLSANNNISCASCHNPSFGWEVPVDRAVGSQNTKIGRHAPTVLNHAWADSLFWDGRAPDLEAQSLGPIQADVEMNLPLDEAVRRLRAIPGYVDAFERAFPGNGIDADTIARAIATFERTVVSTYAPFDAWVAGDENAISGPAKRGFALFNGKAQCSSCHSGWNFTDNRFHDIGLPTNDLGRYGVDSSKETNRYAFRTPTLRDTLKRAPYTHNGSVEDLRSLIYHYVNGGIQRPSLSPAMQSLDLSESEIDDLIAFLHTLTGEVPVVPLPVLPN
ncbi:MAG: cytochrome-c peroxidase [Geminicoccaceae bacterium]